MIERLPIGLVRRLRAWRLRRTLRLFPARVAEHTYGGHRLKVWIADPLSAGWYDRDWRVLPEVAHLRGTAVRPGSRVFNLGAHQGVVALMLAREVGPTGLVVAVEPIVHNATVAIRNRDLNDARIIDILQAAVAGHSGSVTLSHGLQAQITHGESNREVFTTTAVTIDELAARFGTPDAVFLDVEGAEALALEGATQVIASGATFAIEVHTGCGLEALGGSVSSVLDRFPLDRFSLHVRADADDTFQAYTSDSSLLNDRFFLLAQPRAELPQ
jgi:FkbM family methyltransferase